MALTHHTKMKLTTRSCKGKVTRFFFYRTFSNAHLVQVPLFMCDEMRQNCTSSLCVCVCV